MEPQQFNSVLLAISNQLRKDDLDQLKFLVRDLIGKRHLEKIGTGFRLFEILMERGELAPGNTDFLSGLLLQVHRPDLEFMLSGSGSGSRSGSGSDGPETAKLDITTEVIAKELGKNWRKLGRKLRISDVKLESISRRHPTELEETTLELLKEWRKSRGAEARVEELIQALRDCRFNLTADKVMDKLNASGFSL